MIEKEKAKAYDEAIKKLREFYRDYDTVSHLIDVKEELANLFPELKESEDEKVRKAIIELVRQSSEILGMQNQSNILAWLEKQGEQKPIDKIQLGKKYKCIASPRYSTFRRGNIYKPVDNFLCNLMNLCYECFEPIEDSEQKPSDEDMKEALRTEYEKGKADAFALMQKEWSEEDEVRLQACLDTLQAKSLMGKVDTIMTEWLKSLKNRVQPIHEYSETEKQEMFIRSLRPHFWRPSKEQMKAFEHFVRSIGESGYASPYENNTKLLYSLLTDLKKLTE